MCARLFTDHRCKSFFSRVKFSDISLNHPDVGTPNLLSDSYPEDVDVVRCEIIGDQVKAKQLEMECGDFPSIMGKTDSIF